MNLFSSRMSVVILLVIVGLSCGLAVTGKTITDEDVSTLLRRLDRELEKRDLYIGQRHMRIDSLKSIVSATRPGDRSHLEALLCLGDNYNAFNIDSALWFYDAGFATARNLGADSIALRFALRKAKVLPLHMFFMESHALMDSIDNVDIPPGLSAEKVDAEKQMLFYTANFFTNYPAVYDSIIALEHAVQVELLPLLQPDSPEFMLNLAEVYCHNGDYTRAKNILTDLIACTDEDNPLYARACHLLAEISVKHGDNLGQLYYLALSAISDTRCATLEVSSLQELGKELYNDGDIQRSHDYLSMALLNAVDCNASLRIIQTSQAIPLIENAHKEQLKASHARLYVVIVVLILLLIGLGVATRLVKRRNSQLRAMATRLGEASKMKDVYITQFLNLCSIYMDKLNQFNKVVNRKVTAGQTDDLLKLTKSGRFVEEQSKEFYEVFDSAFLHLYPNFVNQINSLLDPAQQLELREGEKLNTDLRILALMRLGVSDVSRIAQMLNYSVYTIYTYRNKIKGRARDRDTFESEVMAIRPEGVPDGV